MLVLAGFGFFLQLAGMAAVAGGAALAAWYYAPRQKILRALREVSVTPVRDAIDGELVRVVGRLRPGPRLLQAPLSGRACALFEVEVDLKVKRGKSSQWRPLIRESEAIDFFLEDDTGRALVRIAERQTALVLDHEQRSGFLDDPTPALEAYVARHGHETTGGFGLNRTLRYREGVLEPDETVAVLGRGRWEDDPDPGAARAGEGYRASARRKRLVIEPSALSPVRVSDDPAALA
jgi:hypothetical protein